MNYFVSIDDSYFHYWQINILINSFKKINLQDKLYIAISSNLNIKTNFLDCKNLYVFKNVGLEKEYLKYNKWYSLYQLLTQKIIEQPLTVLEPHTAIIKDLKEIQGNIVYQADSEFSFDYKYIIDNYSQNKDFLKNNWLNLGDTILFKDVDPVIFLKILDNMELYSIFFDDYKNLDKYCLMNAIWSIKPEKIIAKGDLESFLQQNELNYILNYNYGFKNNFNKHFFKDEKLNLTDGGIKEVISKNRFSNSLDFFYSII